MTFSQRTQVACETTAWVPSVVSLSGLARKLAACALL